MKRDWNAYRADLTKRVDQNIQQAGHNLCCAEITTNLGAKTDLAAAAHRAARRANRLERVLDAATTHQQKGTHGNP